MTTWTSDELTRIGAADELEIASVRDDGTLRKIFWDNPARLYAID